MTEVGSLSVAEVTTRGHTDAVFGRVPARTRIRTDSTARRQCILSLVRVAGTELHRAGVTAVRDSTAIFAFHSKRKMKVRYEHPFSIFHRKWKSEKWTYINVTRAATYSNSSINNVTAIY